MSTVNDNMISDSIILIEIIDAFWWGE